MLSTIPMEGLSEREHWPSGVAYGELSREFLADCDSERRQKIGEHHPAQEQHLAPDRQVACTSIARPGGKSPSEPASLPGSA
jgi:hypothetical protein